MNHHMLWRVKWALVVQPLENVNFMALLIAVMYWRFFWGLLGKKN